MILSAREFLSEYFSKNVSVRLTRRTLVFWQKWTECVSAFYHFTLKAESYPFWQQYRTSSLTKTVTVVLCGYLSE